MKVLLIYPNSPDKQHQPPLGLGYIASVLEKHGHSVEIIDAHLNNLSSEKLKYKIKNNFQFIE